MSSSRVRCPHILPFTSWERCVCPIKKNTPQEGTFYIWNSKVKKGWYVLYRGPLGGALSQTELQDLLKIQNCRRCRLSVILPRRHTCSGISVSCGLLFKVSSLNSFLYFLTISFGLWPLLLIWFLLFNLLQFSHIPALSVIDGLLLIM